MRDVLVTWECFEQLRARYAAYGLDQTPLWRIYSGASIGKAHLREMGVRPWREVQPRFPYRVTSSIMETYYGGRTEAHIRRLTLPGVYLDFQSHYPTSFVLQNLWPYCVGKGIHYRNEPPDRVRRLLENLQIADVLTPSLWSQLHALVLVQPEGDRLPTRARYAGKDAQWAVAVSLRSGGPAQWWTLADCITSKFLTGHVPEVLRVLRFSPGEPQDGLSPVDIAGDPSYRVDPYLHDPIKRLVELRASVKAQMKRATIDGNEGRARELDAIQQGMKVAANAISYGIGIEINVAQHRRPAWATVYRWDGTRYRDRFERTEEVGNYFNPLVATLTAAGGRLLLAAAMGLLEASDGTCAICDTDSLFVPATKEGPSARDGIPLLSWSRVRQIVDRFEPLNPYDGSAVPGSLLKIEEDNFDSEGNQREIYVFAIASKRYAFFIWDKHGIEILGEPDQRRRSRHGLGHLLPPGQPTPDAVDFGWLDVWWEHLLQLELGLPTEEPDWFLEPAAGRLPVTSATEEAAFHTYNDSREYADRVRPFNFLMTFHVHEIARAEQGIRSLVAPFQSDRRNWDGLGAFARHSMSTFGLQTRDPHVAIPGRIPVQTYGDYFNEYRVHPELKLVDDDGRPCHPWSRGLLSPKYVRASALVRIGKTSERVTEAQTSHAEVERAVVYPEPRACPECGDALTDRRARYCGPACKQRAYRRRLHERSRIL
jgi:hypothetical protein